MFSFNSPYGACPDCGGLGVRKAFSAARLIADESLSLRDGALRWGDANWHQVMESSLFKAYKVKPDTPYAKFPARFKKVLWDGAGDREFNFRWQGRRMSYEYRKHWDGILELLRRRYRDTGSESRRRELERLMTIHPCPTCDGARLRPESLAVKVEGKSITEHTRLSVEQAVKFYSSLKLNRKESRSRPRSSRRSASGCASWPASDWAISRWTARRRRCRVARASASGWPRRSVRG